MFLITSATAVAQAERPSQANPAPTPAAKRRTFDQFDLSSGVQVGPSSSAVRNTASVPAVIEPVNRNTYDGIVRMVDYAMQTESEFRSTDGMVIDASDYFEPYRVLSKKLPALFRITEIYRVGLLDEAALKNPVNLALLMQSQEMISEMIMIVNSSEAQLARNQAKLTPIAEKYGASSNLVEKRPLLTAMFRRLNAVLARVVSQTVVAK